MTHAVETVASTRQQYVLDQQDLEEIACCAGCYTPFAAHGQAPPDAVKSLMHFPFLIFGNFCNDLENTVEPIELAEGESPQVSRVPGAVCSKRNAHASDI